MGLLWNILGPPDEYQSFKMTTPAAAHLTANVSINWTVFPFCDHSPVNARRGQTSVLPPSRLSLGRPSRDGSEAD